MQRYELVISHDGAHFMTADLKTTNRDLAEIRAKRTAEAMSPHGFAVELVEWTVPVGRSIFEEPAQ
jgi:hypothetical protein